MAKKKPTGFVATCQCGVVIGALDCKRTDQRDTGKLLSKWLADGCAIQPRFLGTWEEVISPCRCEFFD